ncbi:MAG: YciI family protein [Alphaproteobacteria bacterium]
MAVTNTPNTREMLQKDLYVIFTRPVAPREEIMKLLPKHLERQVELEKQGILFAAGPMEPQDEDKPRTGMIIVRAESFDHAHEIAMGDPFHAEGLREFDIWNWSMNEGSFTVTINYSDQSAAVV